MRDLKIFTNNIEQSAKDQIDLLLEQEAFKDCKIRIMPDVHAGAGCVIGFTGNLGDKVIPNIVGVDIGCGMLCVELGNIDLDLEKLDKVIRKYIPSGKNVHNKTWGEYDKTLPNIHYCIHNVKLKSLLCYKQLKNNDWIEKSIGSLGGGNHFIEIDVDDENNKYLVIHTGSRNLGKQVAEIYQNKAIEYCSYKNEMQEEKNRIIKEYKEQGRAKEIQQALIDIKNKYNGKTKLPKDLCYLEGKDREDYLHDMDICQKFAILNRVTIARMIIKQYFELANVVPISNQIDEIKGFVLLSDNDGLKPTIYGGRFEYSNRLNLFQSIHNYINFEDNIIRKGSISARKGERVIIPMNMRDGCIIGIGKGNEDWNYSAPHGAGRTMSRNIAKQTLNIEDYKKSMNGIYSTSVSEETIDEAPMVYKPMEEIIEHIKDTVEVEKIIKPIYNFKASE